MSQSSSEISFAPFFQGAEHRPLLHRGGRPAALLIHGFPGTPAEMRPLADALHEAGWTVRVPLLPGFGPDIDTLPERRHRDWLDTVTAELRALQAEHSPTLLVGFSMGAALSLAGAAIQPPDGLALLAPFWRFKGPIWGLLPLIRRLVPTFKPFRLFKPDFSDPEIRRGMARFMPGMDVSDPQVQEGILNFTVPVGMIDEVRRAGVAAWRAAGQVEVPKLLVQGSRDDLVLPELTVRLRQRLVGPLTFEEVDAAHDLLDAAKPSWPLVRDAVLQFAGRLAAGAVIAPAPSARQP